jgi:hypothetical protein
MYRRDVIDFLEYDINPKVWIRRLFDEIRDGNYNPETPIRFYIAKSNGFKRQVTRASIPDAALFILSVTALGWIFLKTEKKPSHPATS